MAPTEVSSRSAGERAVWLLKHRDYIPQASRRTIIPVSPGNPLWANIILPADRCDMAADDPLRAGGTRDCLHPGKTRGGRLQTRWGVLQGSNLPGTLATGLLRIQVVEMKT